MKKNYMDFSIRAWQEQPGTFQVMVHDSPAGDIRHPLTTTAPINRLEEISMRFSSSGWFADFRSSDELIEIGKLLASILLPLPVLSLLIRSLEKTDHNSGLRVRLCLDDALMDYPWEYLYRPDQVGHNSLKGFLILNPHVSLVREAPLVQLKATPTNECQKIKFAGVVWQYAGSEDYFEVQREYDLLTERLASIDDMISLEFTDLSSQGIVETLSSDVTILHYAGHADIENGRGYLIERLNENAQYTRVFSDEISARLQHTGVRLAVLNACNSGNWAVVKPILETGLPALIGVQGLIPNEVAVIFAEKLYQFLALGFSLDEAVHSARYHLLEVETDFSTALGWSLGSYLVYMPTKETVLLPRVETESIRNRQREVSASTPQISIFVEKFVSGDYVQGDRISVGNITNSSAIAIGKDIRQAIDHLQELQPEEQSHESS